ncbi:MAG: CAP domain-containing protein [Candidatus Eisenbacteria bacterium]
MTSPGRGVRPDAHFTLPETPRHARPGLRLRFAGPCPAARVAVVQPLTTRFATATLATALFAAWLLGSSCAATGEAQRRSADLSDLRRIETDALARLNWARAHPDSLALHLESLLPCFEGTVLRFPDGSLLQTKEGRAAVVEAIAVLRQTPPLPPLSYSPGLSAAAADLVDYQGAHGRTGHSGRGGSSPGDRANRHGRWKSAISEAITYGPATGVRIVASLIIDDGVPDRGHRSTLLDPQFRVAGVAFGFHARYKFMCVFDLAAGFDEGVH